jgi:hypothetical protein
MTWTLLGLLVLAVWSFRRRIQYEVAAEAVQVAELEAQLKTGGLTGGEKKIIAVAAFRSWAPWYCFPLTSLGLDLLLEKALKTRKGSG